MRTRIEVLYKLLDIAELSTKESWTTPINTNFRELLTTIICF